eukprot:149075_1
MTTHLERHDNFLTLYQPNDDRKRKHDPSTSINTKPVKSLQITSTNSIDTKLTDWIWYKPNNNKDNAHIRAFAVMSDNIIKIYTGRNAFKAAENPIHTIQLLTTTEIIDGNDIVILHGFLSKKGQIKWNNRWCVLRKDGYIEYLDHREKIKCIDFSTAHLKLQNTMIQWKNKNGELVQFYFVDSSIHKKWHYKMVQIQNNYLSLRTENKNKFIKLKSLFSFTILQTTKMVNKSFGLEKNKSINIEEHYFYFSDGKRLKKWEQCIHDSVAEITMNILKKKYASNNERSALQLKKTFKKIQTIANRRNSITKHNHKPSIIDSMNDQIGKYTKHKVNKHKVEKVMKKLEECLESNKYNSIGSMYKAIKKIHMWFFGDICGDENDGNTDLVIEYILDKHNLFFKMFQCINYLDFNARKQMTQIIVEIIKYFDGKQCKQYIISVTNNYNNYGHNALIQCLFDKFDVNSNGILIEMIHHSELVEFLLNTLKIQSRNRKKHYRFVDILLKFVNNKDLVVSLSAYKTLHCLLVVKDKKCRQCVTNYLDHKFVGIFHKIDEMMKYENCLVQKEALRL